jgi:site-specific recombinase XerD
MPDMARNAPQQRGHDDQPEPNEISAGPVTLPDEPDPRLTVMIRSFDLSLRADGKSPLTRRTYIDATTKLARWLTAHDVTTWRAVTRQYLRSYMAWFQDHATRPDGKPYAKSYANNQYRAIQAYWKWWAEEEDEANPMAGMKPPKPGERIVPVFLEGQLAQLLRSCERGKSFEERRDYALLRMFACTGLRLAELTNVKLTDVDLAARTVKVIGKGDKERMVRFDAKASKALDRYIRTRAEEHKQKDRPQLWLGINNRGPLTPNGVRQIVQRRGESIGLDIHPHLFRHDFTHRYLDAGGAEGDLMEHNGWDSPQMLRHYGRSARAARAARAYDRVNVMGDL